MENDTLLEINQYTKLFPHCTPPHHFYQTFAKLLHSFENFCNCFQKMKAISSILDMDADLSLARISPITFWCGEAGFHFLIPYFQIRPFLKDLLVLWSLCTKKLFFIWCTICLSMWVCQLKEVLSSSQICVLFLISHECLAFAIK